MTYQHPCKISEGKLLRKISVTTKVGGIGGGIYGTVMSLIGSAVHFNNIIFL